MYGQKTNFAYYDDYEFCFITIVSTNLDDCIPTTVRVKMELVNNGEVVHTVFARETQFANRWNVEATAEVLCYALNIFQKIHRPTKGIVVELSNVADFLFLTKQISPGSRRLRIQLRNMYKLANCGIPVILNLRTKGDRLLFENDLLLNLKTTFPSAKMLGFKTLEGLTNGNTIQRT